MMRKTSIEAYKAIVEEGIVPEAAAAAYRALHNRGPMTQNELKREIRHAGYYAVNSETARKRISELSAMDVVEIVGKRACTVTGRTCYLWDVTGKMPVRVERKESKDETIKRLTARVAALEAELSHFTPRVIKTQMELFG
jgi:hypothetical protein